MAVSREIIARLLESSSNTSGGHEFTLPDDIPDEMLWKLLSSVLGQPCRKRLEQYSTLADAVSLICKSKKIVVVSGAGISVSCGIPDFRSEDGIYARLHKDFPDLPDPHAMFDIGYFHRNPKPFFRFAKEIYPGEVQPSITHRFIAALDKCGKLLRNYTQNIDCLEQAAGISNLVQCHGSFSTATCCTCGYKVTQDAIRNDVLNSIIPKCPQCPADAKFPVLKPDIVFFGEGLGDEFHDAIRTDQHDLDLLIVIGSSMKVGPVNMIPNSIDASIPQILINRDQLKHQEFDVCILAHCDRAVEELAYRIANYHPPEQSEGDEDSESRMMSLMNELIKPGYSAFTEVPVPPEPELHNVPSKSENPPEPASDLSEAKSTNEPAAKIESRYESGDCVTVLPSVSTNQDNESEQPSSASALSPSELSRLKEMYEPRNYNLAKCLSDRSFAFVPPCYTVFSSGEFYREFSTADDD